jgi:hypothetical protein
MIRLGMHDGSEALMNANWKSGFLAKTPCPATRLTGVGL